MGAACGNVPGSGSGDVRVGGWDSVEAVSVGAVRAGVVGALKQLTDRLVVESRDPSA